MAIKLHWCGTDAVGMLYSELDDRVDMAENIDVILAMQELFFLKIFNKKFAD